MYVSRRTRLIWQGMLLPPLIGVTLDVITAEIARLIGTTPVLPWLATGIGAAYLLRGVAGRASLTPHLPNVLDEPDADLTRRSRVLSERLGAKPVRVFVLDMPLRRGELNSYRDGSNLFISKKLASLPEAELDFALAMCLAGSVPLKSKLGFRRIAAICLAVAFIGLLVARPMLGDLRGVDLILMGLLLPVTILDAASLVSNHWWDRHRGPEERGTPSVLALKVTGNLDAAVNALEMLAGTESEAKAAESEAGVLRLWWSSGGESKVDANFSGNRSVPFSE